MKLFSTLFAIIAMATPAALSAAAFEGKVQMKMTDNKGNVMLQDLRIKDGFLRTEMEVGSGEKFASIIDVKKQELITLMPGQNMYMTVDLKPAMEKAGKGDDVTLEKTGETEKILGYSCTKYVSKSKEGVSQIWATEELGTYIGAGAGSSMGKNKGPSSAAWEKALMGKNFFPLRVVTQNTKGKELMRMEAVSIEKGAQDALYFAPPPGAQKFSFGGMMKGMGIPGMTR